MRNHSTEALVLKAQTLGEIHRLVTILTPDKGLLRVLVPGAAGSKGRNKVLATPFRRVGIKLYHEPVRDQWKSVDLTELALFGGLAEELERFWAASQAAEVMLTAGTSLPAAELYALGVEALTWLDCAKGEKIVQAEAWFLWQFLQLAGLGPDVEHCAHCGSSFSGLPAVYGFGQEGLVCPSCRGPGAVEIPAGGLRWLKDCLDKPVAEVRAVGCSVQAAGALKALAGQLVEGHIGRRLKSFHTGHGVV